MTFQTIPTYGQVGVSPFFWEFKVIFYGFYHRTSPFFTTIWENVLVPMIPYSWVMIPSDNTENHSFFVEEKTLQENYNTPVEHTPGNPPTQLGKESLYGLLVKV